MCLEVREAVAELRGGLDEVWVHWDLPSWPRDPLPAMPVSLAWSAPFGK